MRSPILAFLIAAAPAAADPPVSARFGIDGDRQLRGQIEGQAGPVTGGLVGRTLADPAEIGDLALYVGLRPELPRARVELRLTRPVDAGPAVVLAVDRPLGRRFSLGAQVDARQAGDDEVASLRVTATRRIGDGKLDATLSDGDGRSPRAAIAMLLPF